MKMLKIDIDMHVPDEWFTQWLRTRYMILNGLGYTVDRVSVFKTKRGMHVYIKLLEDVEDETANMLQFMLGDDPTRVKINQWRISRGIPNWNKLFHKVLYRRKTRAIRCYYCGNKIPVVVK
jgi:hypothetical protein